MLSTAAIPFYLQPVKAGFPSPASDYAENALDFNDLLIRNPPATFCLRVAGDSMKDAGIYTGDIVVVDRSLFPRHRDIVVASVEGEFTLKRYLVKSSGEKVLHPENALYPDLEFSSLEEVVFFGVVTALIRKFK